MPITGRLTFGLDAYLETLTNAGESVDDAVTEIMNEASPSAGGMLFHYLRMSSERWTGAAAKTIFAKLAQREGNFIFIEIGADTSSDPAAWYKEYGRPNQMAEPFLRPTLIFYRRKELKRLMGKVLERYGLPTT